MNGEACVGALWVQEIRHFSFQGYGILCSIFFLLPGMFDIFTSMDIGFLGKLVIGMFASL